MRKFVIADISKNGQMSLHWAQEEGDSHRDALERHLASPDAGSTHASRLRNEGQVRFVVGESEGGYSARTNIYGLRFYEATLGKLDIRVVGT